MAAFVVSTNRGLDFLGALVRSVAPRSHELFVVPVFYQTRAPSRLTKLPGALIPELSTLRRAQSPRGAAATGQEGWIELAWRPGPQPGHASELNDQERVEALRGDRPRDPANSLLD
ncbi:MAG: hypothetical protein AAF236_09950 [Verrucomicrobiota bacterium]